MLKGLEAVRKRPGMYIGSTGERGLHHLVWEVVDNAVDEAMAGFASKVDVRILEDGGVEVTDDGRGIPVAMHSTGIPTVDVVMTVLHAGGKFEEEGVYQVSGGLHGVGVSVVNALSTRLEADIRTDGSESFQTYEYSVPGTLRQGEPTKKTGTTIRFWADPNIFETTNYDFETIARRLQEMAFLNKGLTIDLIDERVTADEVVDEVVADTGRGAEVRRSRRRRRPRARTRSSTAPTITPAGWWTSSSASTAPRPRSSRASSISTVRVPATRSRSPCSGTPAIRNRCTPSRTPSTPMRVAPMKRVSAAR